MAIIQETMDIKCPADKAFTYTTEARSWPKWQTFIPEAKQTSQGNVDVGTTFTGVTRLMGMNRKWAAKATDFKPTSMWGKKITSGSVNIQEHLRFAPVQDGTRFTIIYDVNVGGLLRIFSPMIVSSMRRETQKSVHNLKQVLEASNQ